MKILDLFAGLGGWSNCWREAGHEVTTVDLDPRFNPTHCMSVEDFHAHAGQYDIILASPPCTEFSRWTMRGMNRVLRERHEAGLLERPSLHLVQETWRVILECQPAAWVIENVHGSPQFISKILGPHRGVWAKRYLWGNFPELGPIAHSTRLKMSMSSTWVAQRSEIPPELAQAVMQACLTGSQQEEMRFEG